MEKEDFFENLTKNTSPAHTVLIEEFWQGTEGGGGGGGGAKRYGSYGH